MDISFINKLYNTKSILVSFLVQILLFAFMAYFIDSKLFWLVGDFLWWIFLGLGVFKAIELARKVNVDNIITLTLERLRIDEDFLIDTIESEIQIYRPKELSKKLKKLSFQDSRREHLNSIIRHCRKILIPFKDKLDESRISKSLKDDWNKNLYDDLTAILIKDDWEPLEYDNSINRLKYWTEKYNSSFNEYLMLKNEKHKTSPSLIAEVTPFLLTFLVSFQIGKNLNLLLMYINN